jgi:hypothetical protein
VRLAWLLSLLAGCDLVFDLKDPVDAGSAGVDIEVRAVFNGNSPDSTVLQIDRPTQVMPEDVLIFVIHAFNFDETTLVSSTLGLTEVAAGVASSCSDDWHTWIFTGKAGLDPVYAFTFDRVDDLAGLAVAYSNAREAVLLRYVDPSEVQSTPVRFSSNNTTPNSMLWVGGAASDVWMDDQIPSGMTKRTSIQNLAMYDLPIPDGTIPPIEIMKPDDFCPGVGQMSVQQ